MRLFLCKIFQRRLYDLFSSKQSLLLCFAFFCMTLIAILHLFGIFLIWSHKTVSIRTVSNRLNTCDEFPIDVVYTWVNGSDPKLLQQLFETKKEVQNLIQREIEEKISNNDCTQESVQNSCESSDEQNCFETPIVFMAPQINNLGNLFVNVTKFEMIDTRGTLIYFSTLREAQETALRCLVSYNTSTYLVRKTHIILVSEQNNVNPMNDNKNHKNSEIGAKLSTDSLILVCGCALANSSSHSQLLRYLSPFARKQLNVINIYEERQCALFAIKNPIVNSTKIIQSMRMSLERRQTDCQSHQSLTIRHPIDLTVFGSDNNLTALKSDRLQDLSESRFADNQELRYSLRSLERNVNWIRNVFIVTNGQIPNWLNLDNERIKIITHDEIFANKSHLPSFSSPAIETHLHRIPGLSKRFLYLNDDILFGEPIYPEDFYTESKGFKVYLSWPVPNCAEGCPMNWLKDGYCDTSCNSSECLWDGGDCDPDKPNQNMKKLSHLSFIGSYTDSPIKYSDGYCSPNCVDSWLSDKFCDQVCNNINCAFDLGDCGTDNFNQIYGIDFHPKRNIYYFRSDSKSIYFDFNKFFISNAKNNISLDINEISYENNSFVRSSALNMNHKTLVFLFFANQEKQDLNITLKGIKNNSDFVIEFQALVSNDSKFNTSYASIDETDLAEEELIFTERENNLTETYVYSNKTYETKWKIDLKTNNRYEVYPKIMTQNELEFNESLECDFNIEELPNELKSKFNDIDMKFNKNMLTEKGFKNFKRRLTQLYVKQICNYENTLKTFDTTISAFQWERQSTFADIEKSLAKEEDSDQKRIENRVIRRHLMDSYADSLRHVNHIYNQVFGIEMRKVPAHMAHFIDIDIMSRLQKTFSHHFDKTSSHRIRSSDDMQFAFAYNYYLMSELKTINSSELFDSFDVDSSGTWSSSEVRTVILNIYDLPLKYENFEEFYGLIFSCCEESVGSQDILCSDQRINANISQLFHRGNEIEIEQSIEVSKSLIIECQNVTNKLSQLYANQKHNRFEILGEDDVSFKMIRSNATIVAQDLDQLNKHLKKFMCLNDNIDHKSSKDVDVIGVKRMLVQFYESIFPMRSQFELPVGRINRFLYIHDYKQWQIKQNNTFKFNSKSLWICLICFTLILVFFSKKFNLKSKMKKLFVKSAENGRYYRKI